MSEKFIYHIVSETHWDREWYLTFQQFRSQLIQVCDHLLKILDEDPDFKYFTLDGQTIVLDDYLEVMPHARDRIEYYVKGGRILIGPWYVLPDEFLVGGEAMIRNLMLGHKTALSFGAIMKVGYLPDQFGHIGQIPQILRGFDIDNAVVWRGIGEEIDKTEFNWKSPDGSSVLAIYLPDGYCNAANIPLDPMKLSTAAKTIGKRLRSMATTKNILFMNGCDHLEAQAGLPASLRAANKMVGEAELVHSTLPLYIDAVKAGNPKLKSVSGEFRSPARAYLLVGVLSSRMWIKQRNNRCEKILERWVEPLTAWTWLAERKTPQDTTFTKRAVAMNWLAWKYLLQNQPHDSICGCSTDEVHRDMMTRFKWAEEISETAINDNLHLLVGHIDTTPKVSDSKEGVSAIIVFNPSSGPRTDVVHGRIGMDSASLAFELIDEKGTKVAVQGIGDDGGREVEFAFIGRNLPGYGYRVYHAIPGGKKPIISPETTGDTVENEFYRIIADKNRGTVTIVDKENGASYANCNGFVDAGDAGDEYNYSPPREDMVVDRPRSVVSTACEVGPVKSTLRLKMTYALPEALSDDRGSRSRSLVEMPISTSISLYPGVRRIDITTTLENTACDHRLRVHFPTGIATKRIYSEGHFDVVERVVEAPTRVSSWLEQPIGTFPQKSFTDVNNGTLGFMLANRGLPECEALEEGGKVTLSLSLLRCIGWLSRNDLSLRRGDAGPSVPTPEAQCLGHHVFEYAVIPHRGTWEDVFQEAHYLDEPLRIIRSEPRRGRLPSELSWIEVEPKTLVVSAIKLSERGDGIVVRIYNPSDKAIDGTCLLSLGAQRASFVNLNEEVISGAALDQKGAVRLTMRSKAIMSVLLEI